MLSAFVNAFDVMVSWNSVATGRAVRASNPNGGKIFSTRSVRQAKKSSPHSTQGLEF